MQYLHLFVKMPGIMLLVGAVGTVRVVNSKKFLSRRTERKSKQNVGDESVLRTKLPFIVFIFLAPLSFCVKLHQEKSVFITFPLLKNSPNASFGGRVITGYATQLRFLDFPL